MEKAILFLMQGIPEMTGAVALSLALAGVPLRWERVIAAGTVLCVIIFIIRALPFTFGLHTIVSIMLLVIFIAKTTHVLPSRIFITVFASFATLAILELTMYELFFAITGLDYHATKSNYLLYQLVGLPQALLMNIFAVLASRYKKPVQGAWKK